jgi:hypothetical protein
MVHQVYIYLILYPLFLVIRRRSSGPGGRGRIFYTKLPSLSFLILLGIVTSDVTYTGHPSSSSSTFIVWEKSGRPRCFEVESLSHHWNVNACVSTIHQQIFAHP